MSFCTAYILSLLGLGFGYGIGNLNHYSIGGAGVAVVRIAMYGLQIRFRPSGLSIRLYPQPTKNFTRAGGHWVKKHDTLYSCYNFARCWPIFRLSIDCVKNWMLKITPYTLNASLHYLYKPRIRISIGEKNHQNCGALRPRPVGWREWLTS